MIAALYVDPRGIYSDLPDVDVWGEDRDARLYAGPHPVVAHPPCERWGRYWSGGPSLGGTPRAKRLGDDGGCFAAALASVRTWGGVLEHPEASKAWDRFGMIRPPRDGGWVSAGFCGGWTCCVEQGWYGHPSRKATWLYAHGVELPSMRWWRAPGEFLRMDDGLHSSAERRTETFVPRQRIPRRARAATPPAFRDALLAIARTARPQQQEASHA